MRQKAYKQEIGTHRPTENRAGNKAVNEEVVLWVNRVREAGKIQDGDGVESVNRRVTITLINLIQQIEEGMVDREVISELVKRVAVTGSLKKAQEILMKRSG